MSSGSRPMVERRQRRLKSDGNDGDGSEGLSPPQEVGEEATALNPFWVEDAIDILNHVRDAVPKKPPASLMRWRTRRYLAALNHILAGHPSFAGHPVREDLIVICLALDGLDNFVEHEMLRKRRGGNRAPENRLTRQFRLIVLQMLDHLLAAGMSRNDAYKFLADEITSAGQGALKPKRDNPGAPFAATTIKKWYQTSRNDPEDGAHDDAEWLHRRSGMVPLATIGESKAQVRAWLAAPMVRAVFPECAKADS